jgi:hypothetical protein
MPVTAAMLTLSAAPPAAFAETLTFTPEADTYVRSDTPTSTHGTSTGMSVDGSPAMQSFLRFRVSGIDGRVVTSARLRLQQTDSASIGGRVWGVSSDAWAENLTWATRPVLDGPLLGTYANVKSGSSYEIELGADVVRDGVVSLGMDSVDSDGARWATRESSTPPVLSVTVGDPGTIVDGLSAIAAPSDGSSEPTYYSGNHRAVVTAGGRMLTVHGRHSSGVQLAWRDPAGGWRTVSTGASSDGGILTGADTGDWPASIAIGRDANGSECAWVVWSGYNGSSGTAFAMRRLTNLDDPAGPRIGPVVTIDPGTSGGAYRGDIALERRSDGVMRGVVVWSRNAGDGSFELVTKWFTDLSSDTPVMRDAKVLERSTSSTHFGSLVATPSGMTVVGRIGNGTLGSFSHSASAALTTWSTGSKGPSISSRSAPTAVALSSGAVLTAVERDATAHVSNVYRLVPGRSGISSVLQLNGYAQPALAADGGRAWLVGVRSADGNLVSRAFDPTRGWSASDRLEVGPEAGGGYAWPNAVRDAAGRLRFVFEGTGSTLYRSAVLAFQRPL